MNIMPLIIPLLLCFLLLFPDSASGQQDLEFDVLTYRVPGVTSMSGAGDMNGDERTDFLLFHRPSKESRDKFCSIYFQKNGKLEPAPNYQAHLGEQISGVQVVDLDGDGKDEIVGFDGGGVVSITLTGSGDFAVERIISCPSILPPNSRYLAPVNWVVDLTGDNRKDVLVPVTEGMRLFVQQEGSTFREERTFNFPVTGSLRLQGDEHYISYRFPSLVYSDFNRDGRIDLGAFDLERMDFFLLGEGGVLLGHESSPLLRKFTKDFIGASSFRDLNADSIPDAVLVLMSQKKNLESEVQIYFGADDFSYGEAPDQLYTADSSLMFPIFLDATGDGTLEMLLQDVNVGVGFFINYFLRNRIRVDTRLRRIGENNRYEDRPAITRSFHIQASETGTEPARAAGDFNGDGLDDLVVGTSENRLSFFLASETDILPERPAAEFDVPAYGNMSLLDLNTDRRPDLVILYSDDKNEDLAVVLVSK